MSSRNNIDFTNLYSKANKYETEDKKDAACEEAIEYYVKMYSKEDHFRQVNTGVFINEIPNEPLKTSDSKNNLDKTENEVKKLKFHEEMSSNGLGVREDINTILKPNEDGCVSDVDYRDCGEPLKAQFLRLDFTPVKGVDDDDFLINKCTAFWKLIDDHPEIRSLKVEAEPFESPLNSDITTTLSSSSSTSSETVEDIPEPSLTPMTVEALKWLQKKELMNESLVTEPLIKPCNVASQYEMYKNKNKECNWPSLTLDHGECSVPVLMPVVHKDVGSNSEDCRGLGVPMGRKTSTTCTNKPVDNLTHMMAEMNKFDLQHPKSMELSRLPPLMEIGTDKPKSLIVPYIEPNEDKYCEKCLN